MNTEELQKLGLNDEQIKGVMAAYGQAVNPLKEQVNSLEGERDGLQTQLDTVSGQLDTIKKDHKGDEDLKAQIEQLQSKNKEDAEQYQSDLAKTKIDYQTDMALTKAGAKNVKAVKALLDAETIQLDKDGNLTGLDEQLESVKKDNDFLFEQKAEPSSNHIQINPAGNPNPGNNSPIDPATASYAELAAAQTQK